MFSAPHTASLFDEVFSLDWQPIFLEFVQKYFLIFIVVFVINLIVFLTYSSKLLARKKIVFKIVVILNAGVCIVSGLVVFSVFLEKLRIMFMQKNVASWIAIGLSTWNGYIGNNGFQSIVLGVYSSTYINGGGYYMYGWAIDEVRFSTY